VSEKGSLGQSDGHEADHCQRNPGLFGGGQHLIVQAQPAVPAQPGEGPLDHPAPGQHLEPGWPRRRLLVGRAPDPHPLRWLANHLDRPAQRLGDSRRARTLVGGISPQLGQAGKLRLQPGQQELGPVLVLHIRRMDQRVEQQAQRINQQVTLAPAHLLAAVIATGPLFPWSSPIGYP